MPFPTKSKPWSQRPMDHNGGSQTAEWMDWVTTQINQFAGQAAVPAQTGLTALQTNTIDPTTGQIISLGSRMASVATKLSAVATTTTVTIFWDGTNSSQIFQLVRDDGTSYGPNPTGSPLVVSGLSANTQYFFYPYFDELVSVGIPIHFASIPGVSVGSPSIAFTSQNLQAIQQQIFRTRVPLAILFATTGVTTPNAGSTTVSGGNGGANSGGGGGRLLL